ncbi:hypothetical protein RJ639_009312 [Escallonia herrerae]|uniref:Pectinesterase n=1 Tax=Escallonia herrerae TaxID=1293975 RepID=A0AA88VUF2_9ASTE|nr:hypothetical protein RJ639_009312 [Escallonia herrerae]
MPTTPLVFLALSITTLVALAPFVWGDDDSADDDDHHQVVLVEVKKYPSSFVHPSIVKNACTNTFYPSLCHATLSSSVNPATSKNTSVTPTYHHVLEFSINQTMSNVASARVNILGCYSIQDLNPQENNALDDCMEMLDQTLYEHGQAIDDLHTLFPSNLNGSYIRSKSYGNLKTLLSAAMTNENTCIDGFSNLEADSEYLDYKIEQKSTCTTLKQDIEKEAITDLLTNIQTRHKNKRQPELERLRPLLHHVAVLSQLRPGSPPELQLGLLQLLTPILRMISNCLAMTNYMETLPHQETQKNPRLLFNRMPEDRFLAWMTVADRKIMKSSPRRMRPNVTVAIDGSGNYTAISEALKMAPNMSLSRYVIHIKAGIYEDSVVIPREKVNLILVGDGMNLMVITGSKNFVDGFSTFTSATLTVVGDKFLARDLTIINTSGPEKHQAVALRVTSNAAFYRCEIISYQDTLYAHSLRQFYRECTIQGTIDFIFGNAAAIFQNCLILVRKPGPGQNNMVTAQGRQDPNQNTGISLQNCTITAALGLTMTERSNFSTFLGRPWRNYSRTAIMKSFLGDLIHPQGWCKWNEYSTLDTLEYIEYMNFGPGSDTRQRINWAGYRSNYSEDIER